MPLAGVFAGFGADAEAHPARVGGTDFHIGDLGGVDQEAATPLVAQPEQARPLAQRGADIAYDARACRAALLALEFQKTE